jgi:hypothetical protein
VGWCSFTEAAHNIKTEVTSHARGLEQIGIDSVAIVGTAFVCGATIGTGCFAAAVGFGSAASWADYAVSGSPITLLGSLDAIQQGIVTGSVGYLCVIGLCGDAALAGTIEVGLGSSIGAWDYYHSCDQKSVDGYIGAAEGGALSNGPCQSTNGLRAGRQNEQEIWREEL